MSSEGSENLLALGLTLRLRQVTGCNALHGLGGFRIREEPAGLRSVIFARSHDNSPPFGIPESYRTGVRD